MKKLLIAVAVACAAMFANAAAVGWSAGNIMNYKGDAYMFFIDGQNGASISAVTTALDKGESVASMAMGQNVVNDAGQANISANTAGQPTVASNATYTGFFVLFDNADLAKATKYVVISGATGLTKTVNSTAAIVTFSAGNVANIVNTASNWKTLPTPEPTSGLLMLIGCAALGLRRKQK